jgi:MFS family permease
VAAERVRSAHAPALLRLIAARLLMTLAIQSTSVAVGWQVFDWTRDPLMLGMLGLTQFVPMMLLTPFSGQLVDRRSRRDLAATATAACALSLLLLTLASASLERSLAAIVITAGLVGAVRAFTGPSLAALAPELVPLEELPRALALIASTFQFALVAGPALGGLAIVAVGPTGTYTLGVGLLSCAVLLLLSLPRKPAPGAATDRKADVWAGLRFLRSRPLLLGAMSLDLFAVLLGGAVALLPAVARELLQAGPTAFGWLRSAPAVGAAAMGLVLSRWPLRRHVGPIMLAAVGVFGVATIGFGLSRQLWLSLVLLGVAGASDMVSVVLRHSLIQLETPDDMRGRVAAVSQLFIGASNELGELESGVTARWLGLTRAIVLGGVGTLLVVGLWPLLFPSLRRADRLR